MWIIAILFYGVNRNSSCKSWKWVEHLFLPRSILILFFYSSIWQKVAIIECNRKSSTNRRCKYCHKVKSYVILAKYLRMYSLSARDYHISPQQLQKRLLFLQPATFALPRLVHLRVFLIIITFLYLVLSFSGIADKILRKKLWIGVFRFGLQVVPTFIFFLYIILHFSRFRKEKIQALLNNFKVLCKNVCASPERLKIESIRYSITLTLNLLDTTKECNIK